MSNHHQESDSLQRRRFLAASLLGGMAAALPSVGRAQAATGHMPYAELLLNQILDLQAQGVFLDFDGTPLNRYGGDSSNPAFIRIGSTSLGVRPMNFTKCSTFLTRLFAQIYGRNWNSDAYRFYDTVQARYVKTSSPQAYQYGLLSKQNIGFAEIQTLNLALPGDVLSWWVEGSQSDDHTMLIRDINWASLKVYPTNQPNSNPALAGTSFIEVYVTDSSSSTHSFDTRNVLVDGQPTHIAGLGRGVVGLLLDSGNRIVGRTWSLPTSDYYTQQNTWVKSVNSRLKLAPTWGFAIGRIA
jgi:hypothetical protein